MSDELKDCEKLSGNFDETQHKGFRTLEDLLQLPFEKHVGGFEIPSMIKQILDIDQINASIDWYLKWKLTEPFETQNTCTIKNIFGYEDGLKII
jgi:hypothetical protein